MPVKSNRKVALSLAAKQQGNYQRVSSLVLEADTAIEVYVEQFDFPLLLAKQVFTNEDGQEGVLYLVTDDVTLGLCCYHHALSKTVERGNLSQVAQEQRFARQVSCQDQ